MLCDAERFSQQYLRRGGILFCRIIFTFPALKDLLMIRSIIGRFLRGSREDHIQFLEFLVIFMDLTRSPFVLLQTDCFNYIKILLRLNSTHLYVCGTYAFSPVCAYIVSNDLSIYPLFTCKSWFSPIIKASLDLFRSSPLTRTSLNFINIF